MNEKGQTTLKICEQKFNYLNYSKRTADNYLSHIKRFLQKQTKSYLDNYNFTSVLIFYTNIFYYI